MSESYSKHSWWAPVWRGLVVDPDAKHYRRLGRAVWLFLYLILHANRLSGVVRARRVTITRATGIPRRTVQRWLRLLAHLGYITIPEGRKDARIVISKWRSLRPASRVAPQARQP